ncbi:uncharacterized protein N7459_003240 [Penicillium hispanicum]|uniref:uncharacterized protein n=1 Tax=Penicillium hispanicum TaxID=1080232 RepID=UPI00254079B2|nr:uncharacterized protein N7459_003240 [Penicillium hispanicum]KAJ5587475.1 hypothetical protein N7459_003240 [Penicillium hispanicum]
MLFSGMARTRLGRVTGSISRTRTRRFYSTGGTSSNTLRYIATAGVVGVPGLWWLNAAHDEVPHLNSPPSDQLIAERNLSKDEVTQIISQGAYSFSTMGIAGVSRYDGTQLASNSPCEDRFIHGQHPSPWNDGNQWLSWAVFDGHAGWQTADLLTKQLMPFVQHSLAAARSVSSKDSAPSDGLVQHAIARAFLNLDDAIVKTALDTVQSNQSVYEKVKKLAPAYAGSCALLSMYDPSTSTLHVACTGDSRAVLGQLGPDGKWELIPLSVDQSGRNEEEIARLRKEHPGEEEIVKNGRVLGIMVSRAFGDCRWKWPLDFQQDMKRRFFGPSPLTPRYDCRTPPYLTAEPVVTSTTIDASKPSFLIMATDGLWDMLSSQQAVDLVGKWLTFQRPGQTKVASNPQSTYAPFDFGHFDDSLSERFVEERTTVQDDNAAVHLVRNSLGGNHHDLIAGRLAFSSPFSRNVRDDITVQVVFFNVPQ